MVLENQVFRILVDLGRLVILCVQIPPLLLESLVNLSCRLYLVSLLLVHPKVLVGLCHQEDLQVLVLLEGLVFLESLVALETHSVLVFLSPEVLFAQSPQGVLSVPLSLANQEAQSLSLLWGLEDQAVQGCLSDRVLRVSQAGLVSPALLVWKRLVVQVGLVAPVALKAPWVLGHH